MQLRPSSKSDHTYGMFYSYPLLGISHDTVKTEAALMRPCKPRRDVIADVPYTQRLVGRVTRPVWLTRLTPRQ
jgi:hypothetical protein